MRILGINISHNASICQLTNGKIDFFFEEDRFNKVKNFFPMPGNCYYKCMEEYIKQRPDDVIMASIDRQMNGSTPEAVLKYNEDLKIQEVLRMWLQQPIQFNREHHHLYHAYSGFHFSDFDEAIVVVMDGGGSQLLHLFHEVESIYLMNRKECERKFVHATDLHHAVKYNYKPLAEDIIFSLDGTDITLSGRPSMGNLYSSMCKELKEEINLVVGVSPGAEAGKLMGYACYPEHKKAYELQEYAREYTIDFLKMAMEYNPSCKNIVLSGGYALNCTNNYHYVKEFPNYNFFVDPVPHDGGTAIGAALWLDHDHRR